MRCRCFVFLVGAILATTGCREPVDNPPPANPPRHIASPPPENPPRDVPVDAQKARMSPVAAITWVGDYTLGKSLNMDGRIPRGMTDNDFNPEDDVYIAMEVGAAPAGTKITAVWYEPDGKVVDEATKVVESRENYMHFRMPPNGKEGKKLLPGTYLVAVYADGTLVHRTDFHVDPASVESPEKKPIY
ncbi:MAG: hypothetical protein WBX15_12530 [Thermoanaerobaculia bacterium]